MSGRSILQKIKSFGHKTIHRVPILTMMFVFGIWLVVYLVQVIVNFYCLIDVSCNVGMYRWDIIDWLFMTLIMPIVLTGGYILSLMWAIRE